MRILLLFGCALAGCNDPTFLPGGKQLKIGDDADGGMGALSASDTDTFVIPIRRPTGAEQSALDKEAQSKGLMMPVPWVGVRDLPLEIEYTVTNQDATPAKVFFILVGGNEFGDYDPLLFYNPLDPNQRPPPPLMGGSPIDLAPNETRSLTFREDDLAEAAIDLEAIVRYPDPMDMMATPYEVLTRQSDVDPKGTEAIPKDDVIPQVVKLIFVLTADAHVTVDYSVRVRDLGKRLAPAGARPAAPPYR